MYARLNKMYKIDLETMLLTELIAAIKAQLLPISDVYLGKRLATESLQFASAAEASLRPIAAPGRKIISKSDLNNILDSKDTLLGNECVSLLRGDYKRIARELSSSVITMEANAMDRVARANANLLAAQATESKLLLEIDDIRRKIQCGLPPDETHELELRISEIETKQLSEATEHVVKAEDTLCQEVLNREETLRQLDTVELDTQLLEFCDILI